MEVKYNGYKSAHASIVRHFAYISQQSGLAFMEKRFYWLYITVFFNILCFGLIFPVLPLFITRLNATSLDLGLLVSSFALMQFLLSPLMGKASDRYGRKPILLFSIAVTALACFILGSATTLFQLYVGTILQGIGNAGVLPAALAYVADVTSGHNRSKYVSRITGTFALGFMIGPAIGGFLGEESISLPYYLSGILGLFNAVMIGIFLHETHHTRDTKLAIKEGLINVKPLFHVLKGELGVVFMVLFAWSFYIGNFNLATPFFTLERFNFGPHDIGIFFSSVGLISGVTQWFILPKIERVMGDLKVIFIGMVFLGLGQFLVPFSGSVFWFYSFFVVTVLGSSLVRPSVSAYLSKKTKEGQGATMGLASSFESLARVISPLLLGFFMSRLGTAVPFFITSGVIFLIFLLFWKTEIKNLRKQA